MARAGHHAGHLPGAQGARRHWAAVPGCRYPRSVGPGLRQRAGGAGGQWGAHPAGHARRAHAHTRRVARHPGAQPPAPGPAGRGPGRRHRHHAIAQLAAQWRTEVQPAPRRAGRPGHHGAH